MAASPFWSPSPPYPVHWPPSQKLLASADTFPTTGPLFIGQLIGVIIILGGPQYLPADTLARNPVMFVTEMVAMITSAVGVEDLFTSEPAAFATMIALWLWHAVLFATFAEAAF
ncbi:MAG: hypothetical protein B7W99_02955 [Rhodospirillales bacterium 20-58-10]|nr:MAG: hypothetical protein B7W99_02955 [Rhodospirillales bacterium 20-58-10]